jgi:hypothetical protein
VIPACHPGPVLCARSSTAAAARAAAAAAAQAAATREAADRKAQADAACDDDSGRPVRQRKVASNCAEAEAKPVECGGGKAVAAFKCSSPQRLVVTFPSLLALQARKHPVDRGEAGPRHDALDRNAPELLAQVGQHGILDAVERGEVDMATFAGDDVIAVAGAENLSDAKARAGADNAGDAMAR